MLKNILHLWGKKHVGLLGTLGFVVSVALPGAPFPPTEAPQVIRVYPLKRSCNR